MSAALSAESLYVPIHVFNIPRNPSITNWTAGSPLTASACFCF